MTSKRDKNNRVVLDTINGFNYEWEYDLKGNLTRFIDGRNNFIDKWAFDIYGNFKRYEHRDMANSVNSFIQIYK